MKSVLLRATNIYHRFHQDEILKNVNLEVLFGEILGIIGPSGAGKSTLLKILSGLLKPTQGEIFFKNQNLQQLTESEKLKFRNQKMGFVDQFHQLLPELTAAENVALPYWISQPKNIKIPEKALEKLEEVGLKGKENHLPNELSGGQQQRVAIARALIQEPQIIFADEPTGHLDSQNSTQIYELFEDLRQRKKISFVIVTHQESWHKKMDRNIYLKDGKII